MSDKERREMASKRGAACCARSACCGLCCVCPAKGHAASWNFRSAGNERGKVSFWPCRRGSTEMILNQKVVEVSIFGHESLSVRFYYLRRPSIQRQLLRSKVWRGLLIVQSTIWTCHSTEYLIWVVFIRTSHSIETVSRFLHLWFEMPTKRDSKFQ